MFLFVVFVLNTWLTPVRTKTLKLFYSNEENYRPLGNCQRDDIFGAGGSEINLLRDFRLAGVSKLLTNDGVIKLRQN